MIGITVYYTLINMLTRNHLIPYSFTIHLIVNAVIVNVQQCSTNVLFNYCNYFVLFEYFLHYFNHVSLVSSFKPYFNLFNLEFLDCSIVSKPSSTPLLDPCLKPSDLENEWP